MAEEEVLDAYSSDFDGSDDGVSLRKPSSSKSQQRKKRSSKTKSKSANKSGAQRTRRPAYSAGSRHIVELEDRLRDKDSQIEELKRELKTLQEIQRRQEKALNKLEGDDSELPLKLKRRDEEIRALREQLRQTKDKLHTEQENQRKKDKHLQVIRDKSRQLDHLVQEKGLRERADLENEVRYLKTRLDECNEEICRLKKKSDLDEKTRVRLEQQEIKLKSSHKAKVTFLEDTIQRLENMIAEKDRQVAGLNIRSNTQSSKFPPRGTVSPSVISRNITPVSDKTYLTDSDHNLISTPSSCAKPGFSEAKGKAKQNQITHPEKSDISPTRTVTPAELVTHTKYENNPSASGSISKRNSMETAQKGDEVAEEVKENWNMATAKEEEDRRKAAEEEQARRAAAEEEARRKAAKEEQARRAAAEEEARRKAAEEDEQARRKAAEEEAARRKATEEEEARQKAAEEEEARRKAAEDEQRKMNDEAEQKKRQLLAMLGKIDNKSRQIPQSDSDSEDDIPILNDKPEEMKKPSSQTSALTWLTKQSTFEPKQQRSSAECDAVSNMHRGLPARPDLLEDFRQRNSRQPRSRMDIDLSKPVLDRDKPSSAEHKLDFLRPNKKPTQSSGDGVLASGIQKGKTTVVDFLNDDITNSNGRGAVSNKQSFPWEIKQPLTSVGDGQHEHMSGRKNTNVSSLPWMPADIRQRTLSHGQPTSFSGVDDEDDGIESISL